MRAVNIEGLTFRYREADADALADVDLFADQGESVAVIGLTGAGKSTLLRCVNRLVPASFRGNFAGRVSLFKADASAMSPAELSDRVGMVFQDFESQLFSTTAELDVAFGPENLGLAGDEIRARVKAALRAVGMEKLGGRDPATLSGGQKQRLAMASVLSLAPRVLCLDEPTTDLDPEGREEVAVLLAKLCDEGITVILAEHEADLLLGADRIVGLKGGGKVVDEDAATVLRDAELLAGLGVRPPDLVSIMTRAQSNARPADTDEAVESLRSMNFRTKPKAFAGLHENDAKADESLGGELIKFDQVSYSYGNGIEAMKEVSLSIRAGEFVAVLGRNGSGKTTLVKHINGLLRPSGGSVALDDRDSRELRVADLGRRIGFVFQDPDHQIFAGRVYDEVAFAPKNFGFSEADTRAMVAGALELTGLSDFEDHDPFLLTKGMRQRVALAGVLAAGPEVIILDEPTTGLDYPAQRAVMDLLRDLNRAGRTVIIVTHTLWVAAEYAKRCIVMSDGGIAADGPARKILSDQAALGRASLKIPAAMAAGLALGVPALTVDELMSCLEKGD